MGLAVGQPLDANEQAKRLKKKKTRQAKQAIDAKIQAVKDASTQAAKINALLDVVEAQTDMLKYLMREI